MKFIFAFLASFTLILSNALFADPFTMGVVVKIGGIPWFNAMENGISKEARKQGVDAYQTGPTAADPALQVRAIEDLIARGVDVIGIVPSDAKVLEPVLKKAQDAGIKIIAHESPGQKYADWDFELVTAEQDGIIHMKKLAECVKEEGSYVIYIGGLTVPLHNALADAAINYQKAHYPRMHLAADRFGVAENLDDTMRTTRDMMSRYPKLKGILAFGSQGPIGAGRAVMQRNKADDICVIGPFSPGQGRRLVKSGAIDGGYIWNPMTAGEIFVRLGSMLMHHEPITDGMTIEGMGKVSVDEKSRTIFANSVESLDKDNIDELVKMGL